MSTVEELTKALEEKTAITEALKEKGKLPSARSGSPLCLRGATPQGFPKGYREQVVISTGRRPSLSTLACLTNRACLKRTDVWCSASVTFARVAQV